MHSVCRPPSGPTRQATAYRECLLPGVGVRIVGGLSEPASVGREPSSLYLESSGLAFIISIRESDSGLGEPAYNPDAHTAWELSLHHEQSWKTMHKCRERLSLPRNYS